MKDKFFDRQQYLELLERRISGLKEGYRQNLAIIGEEFVGKTSLISKFLSKFSDNHLIILYLEIRPETLASFAQRFISVLLYNFLINSNLALEENLDYLIKKASGYIPRTVEKIKSILGEANKKKKDAVFTELLSLCELIHQETDKYCVVIFDEFHNLESLGIKNLYAEWARLLVVQKKNMYIIISSRKTKSQHILSKDLSLLFGNFEVVAVEPFDLKTSEEYLMRCLNGLNLSKGLRDFIVYFCGGYPLYLELISQALLTAGDKEQTMVDILQDLLFESSGILNQRFSHYFQRLQDNRASQDCISILYLISCGQNKLKEIAHILHKPKKEINARVEQLLEIDVISRSADFLKINDRVFSFWLRFVYQGRMRSLTLDADNQKEFFRENIEKIIKDFLVESNKPIPERMTELLRLFEDDTIQLDRKRFKLNHFREIKPMGFSRQNLKDGLICRSSDSVWIMAFKYEMLTEEDIQGFVKECRKYRHKMQRKIIVVFKDLDVNSRLRALEEKILTWDINNLNKIFELYSKPGIMV